MDGCGSGSGDEASGATMGGNSGLKKGPWTSAEDGILVAYVQKHGEGNWNNVQKQSGLSRCGKSCRLRWANHLRPNLKKGAFTAEEERLIIELHAKLGNKWARMATQLPGRTDNEIKNYWNTRIKRRQRAGLPIYPPDVQAALNGSSNNIGSCGGGAAATTTNSIYSFDHHPRNTVTLDMSGNSSVLECEIGDMVQKASEFHGLSLQSLQQAATGGIRGIGIGGFAPTFGSILVNTAGQQASSAGSSSTDCFNRRSPAVYEPHQQHSPSSSFANSSSSSSSLLEALMNQQGTKHEFADDHRQQQQTQLIDLSASDRWTSEDYVGDEDNLTVAASSGFLVLSSETNEQQNVYSSFWEPAIVATLQQQQQQQQEQHQRQQTPQQHQHNPQSSQRQGPSVKIEEALTHHYEEDNMSTLMDIVRANNHAVEDDHRHHHHHNLRQQQQQHQQEVQNEWYVGEGVYMAYEDEEAACFGMGGYLEMPSASPVMQAAATLSSSSSAGTGWELGSCAWNNMPGACDYAAAAAAAAMDCKPLANDHRQRSPCPIY